MNLFRNIDHSTASVVGFGLRTLLISPAGLGGQVAVRLAGLGSVLECREELYAGLELIMDDPAGYALVVIDCDGLGGRAAGLRAHSMLDVTQRCVPVILISAECSQQVFPESRYEPVQLRAPLSAVSLRVGFEHALQERFMLALRA